MWVKVAASKRRWKRTKITFFFIFIFFKLVTIVCFLRINHYQKAESHTATFYLSVLKRLWFLGGVGKYVGLLS